MKKRLLTAFVTGLFLFCMIGMANATLIYVSQGGNFLGSIEAYSGIVSAADNYVINADPVNGPTNSANSGHIYFYENTDGLYLNMHFGTGGSDQTQLITVYWDIYVNGSTPDDPIAIKSDDANEFWEDGNTNNFLGRWQYWRRYGDGGVLGAIGGNNWMITIDPIQYDNLDYLTALQADSAAGNPLALAFNTTENIVLTSVNPVPEPATMLLLGSGLAGLAGLRRKNKK